MNLSIRMARMKKTEYEKTAKRLRTRRMKVSKIRNYKTGARASVANVLLELC